MSGSLTIGIWTVGAVDEAGDAVSVPLYEVMGGNTFPKLEGTVGSETWQYAPNGTLGINTPYQNDVFTYASPYCPLAEPVWTTDLNPPSPTQCWDQSWDPAGGAGPTGITAPLTATGPNGEALVFDHWQATGVTAGPCYTGSDGIVPIGAYPNGYDGEPVYTTAVGLGTWYDPATQVPDTVTGPPPVTAAAVYAPASPDTTPPIISMTAPNGCDAGTDATGTVKHYTLNQVVKASYDCVDPGHGPATTCQGTVPDGSPIDTSTLGTHTFTVTSTDAVGNTSTRTETYTVVEPLCDPGSYSATGRQPCNPAPAGTFVPTSGATTATPCPAGTYSATSGAIQCTPAPAGYYVDSTGQTAATPCTVGTFAPSTGSSSCQSADAGFYVSTSAATAEELCVPGAYATGGAASCTEAQPGYFARGPYDSNGQYDPFGDGFQWGLGIGYGAVSETACSVGTYEPDAGFAGNFSWGDETTSCPLADTGYYVDTTASTAETACPAGTYEPNTGSTSCTLADAGYYVDTTASTAETVCPAGYTSDAGASSCYPITPPTAAVGAVNPVAVNTAVTFDSSGSGDEYGKQLTYSWTFGDGATSTEAAPSHSYAAAGVYHVCLTVHDGTGPNTTSDPACTYVPVYDPSGGFVTGGGWVDSPAGAYTGETTLIGKATFGFVSKYQKGATVPTGNTEFQFQAAGLDFHSSDYQWLVVNQNGTNAQFKGTGELNGVTGYTFMIWATDGSPDTFRIQITDPSGDTVYDNGFQQALGGGGIIVHS